MKRKKDFSTLTKKRRVVSVKIEFIVETNDTDLEMTVDRLVALKTRPELGCLSVPARVEAKVLWDRTWGQA